jgi:hypothetical protein
MAILVTLLLLVFTSVALAIDAEPGSTVSVPVSVNANGAAYISLSLSYDESVFDYVSISCTGPNAQATGKTMMMYVIDGAIPSGQVGTITLKVKEGAKSGTYQISATVTGAYDVDEKAVNATASAGSVTIKAAPCTHTKTEEKISKQPTCTAKGEKRIVCKDCGEVLGTETIPALGHDFGEYEVTKEPTCTEKGEETSKCSRCDEKKTREIVALGHDFGEFEVTKEPTCTEKGEKTGYCTRCKQTATEEIDALGHDFGEYEVTTEPTCTEKGEETSKCSRCDEKQTREIEALGHDFGEWTVTKEATCTEAGEETSTCSRCGETETREIEALGHDFGEWEIETEATCTEDGLKHRTCSRCDEREEEVIPALGHDKGKWIIIKSPTKEEEGLKELHCTRCDELLETAIIPVLSYSDRVGSTYGLKLSDLIGKSTEHTWVMVSPIDLTKEGETRYPLICSNTYVVGEVIVTNENGCITVAAEFADNYLKVSKLKLRIQTDPNELLSSRPFWFDRAISKEVYFSDADVAYMYVSCKIKLDENNLQYPLLSKVKSNYADLLEEMKALVG